jgi:hypothetical protein
LVRVLKMAGVVRTEEAMISEKRAAELAAIIDTPEYDTEELVPLDPAKLAAVRRRGRPTVSQFAREAIEEHLAGS